VPSPVDPQRPVGLAEVVVAQERLVGAPEGPEIGTAMLEHPLLPEIVEALHVGIAPRCAGRNEEEMDAQEQMQAHDEREAMGVSAPAGRGHLVIHLRESGRPQRAPRADKCSHSNSAVLWRPWVVATPRPMIATVCTE